MNVAPFFYLIIFITVVCTSSYASDSNPVDYCYKPVKPLILSTKYYKNRYEDDLKEYERCRKAYTDMQNHIATMQEQSAKNSLAIWNDFITHHKVEN